ncbi:SRPBCC domain-containing protein [Amycolatopsis dendrobii]|uniref:SRPBCC domain-containing protein n=1 Tax=Amycolatopsis dendrobii TaxID=2760662 RepID=A0A7W3Z8D3_9PSEU|nr:SRPBCC domain-containing protein [Amycolatopsis dendrobii]MBB1152070.1 SRPBCC domain-containing protein [Amycolatopsis dendrobii]
MNPTTITAQPGSPFIEIVRDFDTTPARLFRAYTDPDLISRWLGPRDVEMRLLEFDAHSGGAYRYVHVDTDGGEHLFRGVFHAVDSAERIVQTFEYEGAPGQVSLETLTFEEVDGRTRLRTRSVFPSVEARDAMVASGMERGIRDSMDRLDELARDAEQPGASRVVVDISMSLDGYVTGPEAGPGRGLGIGGEPLHGWVSDPTPRDAEILHRSFTETGAVVMGRAMFDVVDSPDGWADEDGYGEGEDRIPAPPVFVVTHARPEKIRLGERFRFATGGLGDAVAQARAAAGGKDVMVIGGGSIASQVLHAGLADVLRIHLAPIVLGGGTPLFPGGNPGPVRLEALGAVSTPGAEHLTYRVLK